MPNESFTPTEQVPKEGDRIGQRNEDWERSGTGERGVCDSPGQNPRQQSPGHRSSS